MDIRDDGVDQERVAMHDAEAISELEALAQTEVGRNIPTLAATARGGLRSAAERLAQSSSPSVVIVTGAYIPWATPSAAETDGPPGAAILAAGLEVLGYQVRLLTDSLCLPVVSAAIRATSPKLLIDRCDSDHDLRTRLAPEYQRLGITHVVAVERLGPASDGRIRNFRGEDVTAFTPPLDGLLAAGPWATIAVGDGGNEVGMGNVPRAVVTEAIEEGDRVHCVTRCDHLIVAGVSNWGAIALLLATCLARQRSVSDLLPDGIDMWHGRTVEACVGAGAVDGTLGRSIMSVDGLSMERHSEVLLNMWQAALR